MNSYTKSNLVTKEAAVSISDVLEGNMKAVLGEEISDVVEASASSDASTAMAVAMLAAAVSSVVAGNMNTGPGDKKTDEEEEAAFDDAEGNSPKKGVSVLLCFCISSYMI
jgi:hypothetical protein